MTDITLATLVELTTDATRSAVQALLREHPEDFYYFSLICSGTIPFLTAWSKQALLRTAAAQGCSPDELKWSYADSPYCTYRLDLFEPLRAHFDRLANTLESDSITTALQVAEPVMAKLDAEGLFGAGPARLRVVVGAEVMPPDSTNVERLRRLNPPEALVDWLNEAAEPDPVGATPA